MSQIGPVVSKIWSDKQVNRQTPKQRLHHFIYGYRTNDAVILMDELVLKIVYITFFYFSSHVKGRVLAALADGTVAIFHRDSQGQWDLR